MRKELHLMLGKLGPTPFYAIRTFEEALAFFKNLKQPFQKTVSDAKEIYQQYDDREQRDYESRSVICLDQGRIVIRSLKEIRDRYLGYLYDGFGLNRPKRILEIGCGNCINLVEIKKKFGNVELHGLDVSPQRINTAKRYFGNRLDGVEFHVQSITERTDFPDGYFDIVYSMHCIEQISYQTHDAVKEMLRIGKRVVLIEPIFELGNTAQKLYLYNSDHVRILLKAINDSGARIIKLESLDIQSNPVNQSTLVVMESRESQIGEDPDIIDVDLYRSLA